MYYVLGVDNVVECTIIRRVNKFVVYVGINGVIEKAYLCNTGRLNQYIVAGKKGFCIEKPSKKTRYRLIAIEDNGYAAIVDTWLQMKAFEKCVRDNVIPWLKEYRIVRRSPRVDNVVLDYMVSRDKNIGYIEVKSAVLRSVDGYAMYPDTRSIRGERQLLKLTELASRGTTAFLIFIAAIPFAKGFKPNIDVSPWFYELLKKAYNMVVVKAIGLLYSPFDSRIYLYSNDLGVYI